MRKVARYGEMSTAEVISAWPYKSSKGTTTYEIQLHSDGLLTCNCPGWVNRKSRDCHHVKEKVFESQQILDGKKPRVFDYYAPGGRLQSAWGEAGDDPYVQEEEKKKLRQKVDQIRSKLSTTPAVGRVIEREVD